MLTCQIEKRFGAFHLDVNLQTDAPVLALFGPSGSGKSLTLQCIAGLLRPDKGCIRIGDRTLFDSSAGVDLAPRERRTGYLFQNYALFPHLTVQANVGYGLAHLSRGERQERVQEVLRAVRLESVANHRPAQLSGGQAQRVALARALAIRPALLLLDEPFAALDSILKGELHYELMQLLAEQSLPTILVTHQLDEAYALATDIAVYEAGHVLQTAPRDQLFHHPQSRAVARLVGAGNFLPGRVLEVTGTFTRVAGPGIELWAPPGPCQPGQEVTCCIRPEHVMLLRRERPAPPTEPGETRLHGSIIQEVAYGSHVSLQFRPDPLPGGEPLPDLLINLATYMQNRLEVAAGSRQTVTLKSRYIQVLAQ